MIVVASFIETVQYKIEIVRNKIPIWKMKRNIELADCAGDLTWLIGWLSFLYDFLCISFLLKSYSISVRIWTNEKLLKLNAFIIEFINGIILLIPKVPIG